MVRAAAKNYNDVTVITCPGQYDDLIKELNINKGSTSLSFRQKMSEEAFSETAYYDSLVSNYFNKFNNNEFPKKKTIYGNLIEKLRYGENPHQSGAIYSSKKNLDIKQIYGKKLSYNNYNDIFSALTISKSFPKNIGTVIVKTKITAYPKPTAVLTVFDTARNEHIPRKYANTIFSIKILLTKMFNKSSI